MKHIAVIGAGPGGYVAAVRLAQLGGQVTIFEKDTVGGTCLNRGCIPTKTYFKNAQLMQDLLHAELFGLDLPEAKMSGEALYARKQKVVETLVGGICQLLGSYPSIRHVSGKAVFEGPKTLTWEEDGAQQRASFDAVIIATGSEPKFTETQGIDLPGVITSDDLLSLREIPDSMIVIGGGVIGLEFASIYNALGTEVTLLASRVLKDADGEVQKRMVPILKKEGIQVLKDIRAEKIEEAGDLLRVTAKYKEKDKTEVMEARYVLVASGRGPVVEGYGLETTGVEYSDKRGIAVDPTTYETNVPGVYAIGDVNSVGIQLAHVASAQGESVAARIMGREPEVAMDAYPACVFTLTEVAQVGKTEEALQAEGKAYRASKFPFAANGKALSLGESQGFVKLLEDEDGYLLGAHILGPHANDLISECALVIAQGLKTDAIRHTIHAHPTLSEAVLEAALDLKGEAIHIAKR